MAGLKKTRKPSDEQLFLMIKNWLTVYLPVERAMSPNTIRSYREAMNQYLDYIATSKDIPLASVTFDMMNSKTLNAFLNHLQTDFHFSVATRNNRLAAIRAFIDYASACSAEYISSAMDVDKIKSQRDDPYSKVDYMTEAAVKAILKMPDLSTKKGRRDLAILSLIYDSGSRIGELLGIRICDLRLNLNTPTVTLHGKGNVIRTVPITSEAYVILQKYLKEFQSGVPMTSETPLFYVEHHSGKQPICAQTVRERMEKYRAEAKEKCPDVPDRIHPHLWRHTRAMHLYQHGVPLELIAQWLGHKNPTTTLIYAYADTEHKRKAIEKATGTGNTAATDKIATHDETYHIDDEELLKRLYGLK